MKPTVSLHHIARGYSATGRGLLLALMVAAGISSALLFVRPHSSTTYATHAMPCADVDGDGAVSQVDVDIEVTYLFIDFGNVNYEPASNMDGDGLIRTSDVIYVAGQLGTYASCQDTPFTWFGGTPPAKGGGIDPMDLDADGCPDVDENGPAQGQGGLRSYLNPWDYWNPSGDGLNRIDDVLLVLSAYFGTPSVALDRTLIGPGQWNLGPPDGMQTIQDVLYQLYQYFHDCS